MPHGSIRLPQTCSDPTWKEEPRTGWMCKSWMVIQETVVYGWTITGIVQLQLQDVQITPKSIVRCNFWRTRCETLEQIVGSRFEVILEHNNVMESHLHISCSSKDREWWLYGWMLFLNDLKLSMEISILGSSFFYRGIYFLWYPKSLYSFVVSGWEGELCRV